VLTFVIRQKNIQDEYVQKAQKTFQNANLPDRKEFMRSRLNELIDKTESNDESCKFGSGNIWLHLGAAGAALAWLVVLTV
jgi:spore coat protein CotF